MNFSLGTLLSVSALALCAVPFVACGSSTSGSDKDGTGQQNLQTGDGGGDADDCDGEEAGSIEECELPNGDPGTRTCEVVGEGEYQWGDCQVDGSAASTPLVISFDGAPVEYASSMATFDINGESSVLTDWPTAKTPWLAVDWNENGRIDDGSELFGSGVVLSNGQHAENGFIALAELDVNHDGVVDAKDPMFGKLVLWSDANADRTSSSSELETLASRGVSSISVGYQNDKSCDARGNCEIETASITVSGSPSAKVIDIHLAHR
jgi:hypothetical protein